MHQRMLRALRGAMVLLTAGFLTVTFVPQPAYAATFNVRDYGATGNGSSNDTPAINNAITAANAAGGGTVLFPSGTYKAATSIHMKSNVTLQLDAGSTIMGASNDTYDAPESNPFDQYQDYGHSHFHNAMIWGNNLTNIGFVGTGTIDGGGHLITGNPGSGEADKIISLTRCNGLTLSGIRLRRGGHFAALTNNCNNITSDRLRIDTASDRDGWNIISATNVTVTNANIAANDDALAFKSDYALGAKLPNGNVTVSDSALSAGCCNALMFGSETCGDFTGYHFDRITITGASKSGLGMVSMDGANISDVHYRDITMTGTKSHIMMKVGTRKRCGNNPGVGHISNITFDNITGSYTGSGPFSPTIWGESGGNQISDVHFNNVKLTVPGGNGTMSTGVPSNDPKNYNPNSIGTRPAFGWYVHNARDITWTNSRVEFNNNDGRPGILANTGSNLRFDGLTVERGTASPHDVGFQSVTGYCVTNGQNTTGGALRLSNTGSTQNCPVGDDFSVAVTPASRTVAPGGSTTYTVNTSVVAGTPGNITLSASGLPPGATGSFSPNPVPAGSSSTLTVDTSASTPNGTSTVTVTGTGSSGTHSATTSLTVSTPGSTETVIAEAESGSRTAPLVVGSDPLASGGQYVWVPTASTQTANPPTAGFDTLPFTVGSAGTYKVWGRAVAPANTDDSFWVRIDSGAWTNWNDITPGSAWHWAPVTNDAAGDTVVLFNLAAGAHTLQFAYREDGTKLDKVLITNDLSLVPSDTPPAFTRYEAENATISQGVVESNWAGFTGTGFVNSDNVVGSYVEWTANAAQAGNATVTFRFANGTAANRPIAITVNGVAVTTLPCPGTGSGTWTTWQTAAVTAALNAGVNTIRATGTTATGGPNLDNLEVAQ